MSADHATNPNLRFNAALSAYVKATYLAWCVAAIGMFALMASTHGDDAHQLFLQGWNAENGDGEKIDMNRAVSLYRKADDAGHPYAKVRLGQLQFDPAVDQRDEAAGTRWCEERMSRLVDEAEKEDPHALYIVGVCQLNAQGTPRNERGGVLLLKQAATLGLDRAELRLGDCYSRGQGVNKSPTEAARHYKIAAERGLAEAQSRFGQCLVWEQGVACDKSEGLEWLKKAANQDCALGIALIGNCHMEGHGLPVDQQQALTWYQKGAALNDVGCQLALADAFRNGKGVPIDLSAFFRWTEKAARRGDATAQFNLGIAYLKGDGVGEDKREAKKWLSLAADQGVARASRLLGRILDDEARVARGREEVDDFLRQRQWRRNNDSRFGGNPLAE